MLPSQTCQHFMIFVSGEQLAQDPKPVYLWLSLAHLRAQLGELMHTGLALCYSVGEYCTPVWLNSSHTKLVDVKLNQTRTPRPNKHQLATIASLISGIILQERISSTKSRRYHNYHISRIHRKHLTTNLPAEDQSGLCYQPSLQQMLSHGSEQTGNELLPL